MQIRVEGTYGPRIEYALEQLSLAAGTPLELVDGDAAVIAGTLQGSATIRDLAGEGRVALDPGPESLCIAKANSTLIAAGSDEQGLMYALLEIAEQIDPGGVPLDRIEPVSQRPNTALRGIFTFLHNADCEADWFGSRDHWTAYFDLLARSRFNSFMLVMAHQTSYLAPPFPFFVDVPEHPEVAARGLSVEERTANLEALRMITELAAARGLDFVLGIWQVIAWLPTSRGGHTQQSMVDGLNWENLRDYTYHATKRLLDQVPGIRGLQLRVNGESGVPDQHQTEFFTDTIFRAMQECDRDVYLDLRGWMARRETIDAADELGIPMRLSMKYWAEHLGAPYQAAKQAPAYSYADFLRYPRRHPISYQVWALGSHRTLLWGDPQYARSFAKSLHFGEGVGFEISPPLAQKGFGNEPGAWRLLGPDHEYYRWEWERYWLFYLLFGRLTYDPAEGDGAWRRILRARFGGLGDLVLEGYVTASQVVSFLIRFNMSDPNMYIWPEADTGGLLDFFIAVPTSDPARMKGFTEAASERISGEESARIGPVRAALHLERLATRCLEIATEVRAGLPSEDGPGRRELLSTAVDVEALGELAAYHAVKIRAGADLALYYASGDYGSLTDAAERLAGAAPRWERLSEITNGVYTDRIVTGPVDSGHWSDKRQLVDEDGRRLAERVDLHRRYSMGTVGGAVAAFDFGAPARPAYTYTRLPVFHEAAEIGFTNVSGDIEWRYAEITPHGWSSEGPIETVAAPLSRHSDRHLDTVFRDTMASPGYEELVPFTDTLFRDYVAGSHPATFKAVVPAGRYEVIGIFCDRTRNPSAHGPFRVLTAGKELEPVRADPGTLIERRAIVDLERGLLEMTFVPEADANWFCSAIVARPAGPTIRHVPIHRSDRDSPLTLRTSVSSPEGIREVLLHLDGDPGTEVINLEPVEPGLLYEAAVPTSYLSGSHLRYAISAVTKTGRRSRLPSLARPEPDRWFEVSLLATRGEAPTIRHTPPTRVAPGVSFEVAAEVTSDFPLRRLVLHYRYTNQYYEWQAVPMDGGGSSFTARIPDDYIVTTWDLMYYIEAVDAAGNGSIAPGGSDLYAAPYWVVAVERS